MDERAVERRFGWRRRDAHRNRIAELDERTAHVRCRRAVAGDHRDSARRRSRRQGGVGGRAGEGIGRARRGRGHARGGQARGREDGGNAGRRFDGRGRCRSRRARRAAADENTDRNGAEERDDGGKDRCDEQQADHSQNEDQDQPRILRPAAAGRGGSGGRWRFVAGDDLRGLFERRTAGRSARRRGRDAAAANPVEHARRTVDAVADRHEAPRNGAARAQALAERNRNRGAGKAARSHHCGKRCRAAEHLRENGRGQRNGAILRHRAARSRAGGRLDAAGQSAAQPRQECIGGEGHGAPACGTAAAGMT